ncbi:hypothetical protein [Microlunatus speluncae]|uniref:hypothetical protein n=1 Tax=Microlunatus speluncae TaxID=2594267 RepID=UPI0012666BAA|nr:hypothetical protein [Microlunatus speluncae]
MTAAAAALLTVGAASTASAEIIPGLPELPILGGLLGGSQDEGQAKTALAPGDEGTRWYGVQKAGGGLVEITDNNLGPFQACNNDVPINAVGGAVDASGLFAILGSDGNSLTEIRNCDQVNSQYNDAEGPVTLDKATWYEMGSGGSLVEISDNNVGPFQVCNNDVPINAVGGAGVVSGLVGILSDDNSAEFVRACSQDSVQEN